MLLLRNGTHKADVHLQELSCIVKGPKQNSMQSLSELAMWLVSPPLHTLQLSSVALPLYTAPQSFQQVDGIVELQYWQMP